MCFMIFMALIKTFSILIAFTFNFLYCKGWLIFNNFDKTYNFDAKKLYHLLRPNLTN